MQHHNPVQPADLPASGKSQGVLRCRSLRSESRSGCRTRCCYRGRRNHKRLSSWCSGSGFIKLANKKKSSSPSLNAFIKGVGEDDNLVMIMIKLK